MKPKNIIYISCDPDTLARDLQLLLNGMYKIDLIQPLDMFPHTHHVETIVILTKQLYSDIILASSSPRRKKRGTSPKRKTSPRRRKKTTNQAEKLLKDVRKILKA